MISIGSLLLKSCLLRKSLLTNLKSKYFHELGLSFPLDYGYWAHLMENDSYNSFSEIFLQQEYKDFLPSSNLLKMIDLGAHYGYFSLWLQSKIDSDDFRSLLIEPSLLCRRSLDKLTNQPTLSDRFKYIHGAIGKPTDDKINFIERPFMAGSSFDLSPNENSYMVNILKVEEILQALPPPYDLIKCDIEGSEWDLIEYYPEILQDSKYLLMEWHSWHNGGGSVTQITEKLKELGFGILKSSDSTKALGREGEVGLFLAENLTFNS
jgi:FkbM family methyltransferase